MNPRETTSANHTLPAARARCDWPLVTRLRTHHTYPCVSILSAHPSVADESTSTEELLLGARRRLACEMAEGEIDELLAPAEQLVGRLAALRPGHSSGLFVSPEMLEAVEIPSAVVARVAVDDTFATRDLVTALVRRVRFYALAVSRRRARLFEDDGTGLVELREGGWPMEAQPSDARNGPPDRASSADRRDVADQRLVRVTEVAMRERLRRHPASLIVLSTPTMRAHSDRLQRIGPELIGEVSHGGLDDLDVRDIAALVQPLVDEYVEHEQLTALAEIDAAIGATRCASGVDEVWSCALEGRGELLAVEESFVFPALVTASGRHLAPADDVHHPEVFDDMVDDVIEQVLSTRGRVVMVPDGSLSHRDRIALSLRY